MKNRALLGAMSAVALVLGSASALAGANGGPAIIVKGEESCTILDGSLQPMSTDDTHLVITRSPNGNATFRCSAKGIVTNDNGRAMAANVRTLDEKCGVKTESGGYAYTDRWQLTVSGGGQSGGANATLVCHLPSDE